MKWAIWVISHSQVWWPQGQWTMWSLAIEKQCCHPLSSLSLHQIQTMDKATWLPREFSSQLCVQEGKELTAHTFHVHREHHRSDRQDSWVDLKKPNHKLLRCRVGRAVPNSEVMLFVLYEREGQHLASGRQSKSPGLLISVPELPSLHFLCLQAQLYPPGAGHIITSDPAWQWKIAILPSSRVLSTH